MAKDTEKDMLDEQPEEMLDDDVIVIRKSWLVTAGVGLGAFVLGGLLGVFVFGYAYSRASTDQEAILRAAQAAAQQGAQVPQPTQPPQRIDGVSADDDPFIGPEDAPVTIVEFSDFQCPYCKRWVDQTYQALLDQYGDQIRIVYRDFPLTSIHPDAQKAAEAAECADEQGRFWEMHDIIFANQVIGIGVDALTGYAGQIDGLDAEQLAECVDSGKYADEIAADLNDGTSYGVSGTPTFFINGYRLVGAQPLASFTALIEQELQNN
jgi:protein-disulfide isomerase